MKTLLSKVIGWFTRYLRLLSLMPRVDSRTERMRRELLTVFRSLDDDDQEAIYQLAKERIRVIARKKKGLEMIAKRAEGEQ